MLSRPSRPYAFRNREIRLVGVDGETWVCGSDMEVALGHPMGIPNWAMDEGEIVMASIAEAGGVSLRLCVSFRVEMGMSARSNVPSDDVVELWEWLKKHDGPWSPVSTETARTWGPREVAAALKYIESTSASNDEALNRKGEFILSLPFYPAEDDDEIDDGVRLAAAELIARANRRPSEKE